MFTLRIMYSSPEPWGRNENALFGTAWSMMTNQRSTIRGLITHPGRCAGFDSSSCHGGACSILSGSAFTWVLDLIVLTKARVNTLVVGTTFFGFALHAEVVSNFPLLLQTLLATGFVACGAAVANQVLEHEYDRKMPRTQNRPLAARRISRSAAGWLSGALGTVGCVWLWNVANLTAMLFAGLAFLVYAFLYTPLKRHTPACTVMGAIAGALPFAVGWAATGADFGFWTFLGLAILFVWQIPHVLAIAWWRRTEYSRAGFRMISQGDFGGNVTARWMLGSALALIAVSLLPIWLHNVSHGYLAGSLALGIPFVGFSVRLFLTKSESAAKTLFFASLLYLPSVYVLMLACQ